MKTLGTSVPLLVGIWLALSVDQAARAGRSVKRRGGSA